MKSNERKIYLQRESHFSSAHKLSSKNLTLEENQKFWGKCSSLHGHNYKIIVTLYGEIDAETGMVFNINLLKPMIEKVVNTMDHKNLDEDVEFFRNNLSTAENIAVYIWDNLVNDIPNKLLYSIKLWETDRNSVIYKGSNP
ncbi:hypothetical protein HK099_001797 [Clydaea vesicula]|uniref:6-pyruvoyl tetrahydrobiopterin synthase n=1 Tax=Clydaea vesicula TaxID=447962 RepID=A0AAD5XX23_9FUNG|nr:hypothetical protein HK099_001797 [Clydaea vesicula]